MKYPARYLLCPGFREQQRKLTATSVQRQIEEHEQRKESLLSIIIPTLNEERFLPALLSSIELQGFHDYEVIVADAGSEDGTLEIAKKHGCRIVIGGRLPAIGRNNGAKAARGKYLLFLDADVVLPEDFLGTVINEFENRNLDVASCQMTPLSSRIFDSAFCNVLNGYFLLTQHVYPHAPGFCILARKDINDAINGFDECIRLAEDHDYVNRAMKYGAFGILRGPRVFVSVRRLDTDGRFNITAKYLLCELYRIAIGEIRTDIFNYKFAHYNRKEQYKGHHLTGSVFHHLLSDKELVYKVNLINLLHRS
ncbi:MAG: glycosyltransferase [Dehalococcoidia bacterium]|nr:glycosyltransferase [Dehalococcoidia bacterium]